MLAVCIGESQGLRKKDRNAFLAQLDAELAEMRAVP